MVSHDATITIPSGMYELRNRKGAWLLLNRDNPVASGRVRGTFSGIFDQFRLDDAISGWAIVSLDGHLRLNAFANGDSFDIEAEPNADVSKLPLLTMFGHWIWHSTQDETVKQASG